MGFWDDLLQGVRGRGTALYTPRVTYIGASEFASLLDPANMSAVQMWSTQPHFRTVISFLARNVAQLGLHAFIRDGENRHRDRSSAVAVTLNEIDGNMTTYDLVFALVGDLALYDRAYWMITATSDTPSGYQIRRLPPTWVEAVMQDPWTIKHYRLDTGKGVATVKPELVLAFSGYHPNRPHGHSPVVESLRETLQEQVEASKYRAQIWKRGGRVSSILERPAGAPPWSDGAREAFREDWYAKYTGKGSHAGGTPILEDGMTLKRIDFNAQEQQFVEAAKLSLRTVASAFHVNPTMIGDNDGANYANVREFRKMLYGDTLGPLLAQIEARLNRYYIPMVGGDRSTQYLEFNIEEKLQGNFEEQSNALQSATGAPWMTRNEARAVRNLPQVEGGDALVTPLNVLVGGQASPRDSTPPKQYKEQAPQTYQQQAQRVFSKFFARQYTVIKPRLGAKAPGWWDQDRWDQELTDDLYALAVQVTQQVAGSVLEGIGFSPSEYDMSQTLAFLRKVAERIAGQVNQTTLQQLQQVIAEGELDSGQAVDHVFEIAQSSRAEQSSTTLTTTLSAFATVEAGRQVGGSRVRKRWVVNSTDPRASHASMDGEEVPVDEEFSNGLMWPGSYGDPDEVAGCQCSIDIVLPS